MQFPTNRKESSTSVAETSNIEKVKRLDYFGIASFAVAVVSLLLALTAAGTVDGKSSTVYTLLGLCVLATVVFTCHECVWATKPLVPLRLITQGIGQYWLVQVILFSGRNGVSEFFMAQSQTDSKGHRHDHTIHDASKEGTRGEGNFLPRSLHHGSGRRFDHLGILYQTVSYPCHNGARTNLAEPNVTRR